MRARLIAEQLARRVESLVREWFPQGVRQGHEWRVGSTDGEAGRSLGIHLSGEKAGVWCDFATGVGGDLLDLWCEKHQLTLPQAMLAAQRWLGLSTPRFYPLPTRQYQRPNRPACRSVATDSAVMTYLTQERKLTPETLAQFKIAEQGRVMVFPYLRDEELIQVKYLALDRSGGKKQIWSEKNCEPCLFGWQALPAKARSVTLTEGEIDAMSLHQYGIPALSIPFGGGTGAKHQWIEVEFDRLEQFDEIYICFDNDSEGQAAVIEVVQRLGSYRCKIVHLPHKDANACLQQDVSADVIKTAFADAQMLDPQELKSASLYGEQVIRELYAAEDDANSGLRPPFGGRAKKLIRFRPGELSLWTGTNGHGKSQFLGHIALHAMRQGLRVCIASMELSIPRLLARLVRQAAALERPTEPYILAIHQWYADKLWLFDLVGTAKAKRLLEVFVYARQRYGVNMFIIDSLMKCGVSEEDYQDQKNFVEALCDFKNEHQCHVHLIAHPRKNDNDEHMPRNGDIKGTGTIVDLADNCFTVWRNKKKEHALELCELSGKEPDEKILKEGDCLWLCTKQRNGGHEGRFPLWFHPGSTQYLDGRDHKPRPFVEYSQLDTTPLPALSTLLEEL